jgi:energy-coupling factor transporter ATP-binding protein EcfA2
VNPERVALTLSAVSISFGDRCLFDRLDCSIPAGRYVGLVGPNGSGKTTLASMIVGLIAPDSGGIDLHGHTVGLVLANPENQIVRLLVEEDLAFGPENLNLLPDVIEARIDRALEQTHARGLRHQLTSNLSGGQLSKVAFAGQLTIDADILIVDEGTAMLDPRSRKVLRALIHELNRRHAKTVIHISHRLDDLEDADLIYLLDGGRLAAYADIYELLAMAADLPGIEAGERVMYQAFLNSQGLAAQDLRSATNRLAGRLV